MPAVELRPHMKNLLGFSPVCKGAISLPSYHSILCILTVDERGTKEETYVQDKNTLSYGPIYKKIILPPILLLIILGLKVKGTYLYIFT